MTYQSKINPGETYGVLRVIWRSTLTYEVKDRGRAASRHKWRCECLKCGAVHHYTAEHLRAGLRNQYQHCNSCQPRAKFADHAKRSGPHCPQCYDLPHRRPAVGLCGCGKAFEAEVFGPSETYRGRSRIADCAEVF